MEFAFEDAKELRRRTEIIKKIETNRKLHDKKDDVPDEEKLRKSKEKKNLQIAAKLQIEHLVDTGSQKDFEKIREHLHNIHSRGLKQRMKKKISEKFGIDIEDGEGVKKTKREKSGSVKQEKKKAEEKGKQKQEEKRDRSQSRNKKLRDDDLEELNV